ncbi:MAG: GH144, partial [uncultured Gemmatimonadaceae bacterium]
SGVLLPLLGPRHRPALRARRALHHRHGAAPGRRARLPAVLRRAQRRRARDPRARRLALPARRLELGARRPPTREHGVAPRARPQPQRPRLQPERVARLHGGDAALRARPRLAHAPAARRHVGGVGDDLQVGPLPGAGVRAVRAAVRASVLARVGGLPRHPRPVHARPGAGRRGDRLLRELAPRHAVAARLRHGQPGRVARLRPRRVGPHGERRPARLDVHGRRPRAHLPHLLGARRRHRRAERRRHDRAHGGRRVDRVRARGRGARARGHAPPLRRAALRPVRLRRRVQPDAARPGGAGAPRPRDARPGVVRHRLPRHRPGADPAHAREPALRPRVAADARQPVRRTRPVPRRLPRGVAGWEVL